MFPDPFSLQIRLDTNVLPPSSVLAKSQRHQTGVAVYRSLVKNSPRTLGRNSIDQKIGNSKLKSSAPSLSINGDTALEGGHLLFACDPLCEDFVHNRSAPVQTSGPLVTFMIRFDELGSFFLRRLRDGNRRKPHRRDQVRGCMG